MYLISSITSITHLSQSEEAELENESQTFDHIHSLRLCGCIKGGWGSSDILEPSLETVSTMLTVLTSLKRPPLY